MLNAKTHGNELQDSYPDVVALRPKTCSKCGVEKLQLEFCGHSSKCKPCIREYVNSRKPKLDVTNGFVDFNLNIRNGRKTV